MTKFTLLALGALVALSACAPITSPSQPGPDGQPVPAASMIDAREAQAIPARVLQQINTLRGNIAAPAMRMNPQLTATALAHSRDMAAQNRAWHWGSDGSSPLERVRRQGYSGQLVGENISESYENDIQTLNAWMQTRDTRDVIMDPTATSLGFAWYQEPSGKIWWTLISGT